MRNVMYKAMWIAGWMLLGFGGAWASGQVATILPPAAPAPTSAMMTETVTASTTGKTRPVMTITSSTDPAALNEMVNFYITLTAPASRPVPTGTINLLGCNDGTPTCTTKQWQTVMGNVALTGGKTECTIPAALAGTFAVKAVYSGDQLYY